jgi:hypothetical protein
MDTPIQESSESSGPSESESIALFGDVLDNASVEELRGHLQEGADEPAPEPPQGEPNEVAEGDDAADADATEGDDATYVIKIDGKDVLLTAEQIADAYKGGLKEKDYRQKTMAVAKERDAAQAEKARAAAERQQYAQTLQTNAQQLAALVQGHDKTDWDALLESDPVEFLKQRNLADKRQAALNQHHQQLQAVHQQQAAYEQELRADYLVNQREELLAKVPTWKDATKAKAEMTQIAEYLKAQGYDDRAVNDITDHRPVLMARKAMLYDQMMSKAQAATKKVSGLPTRTERPGFGESQSLDKRSSAFQRLKKSGRDSDAVALFGSMI